MNIEDKIKIESNNISYQFDATMESTRNQILKELNRGRVGLADPLTPLECIDYVVMGAKLNYSFYQYKFIDKLFEAGLIKSDPLVASQRLEDIKEDEFKNFFEDKLSDLQANLTDYLTDPIDQAYFTREFWEFRDLILNYIKQQLEAKND
jgi:hypothetical protein